MRRAKSFHVSPIEASSQTGLPAEFPVVDIIRPVPAVHLSDFATLYQAVLKNYTEGLHPSDQPIFPRAEVARLVGVAGATVGNWRRARVVRPDSRSALLPFTAVVEAAVVADLRKLGMSMHSIQAAVKYAADQLGVSRPLLDRRLYTDRTNLFIDWEGANLVNLSKAGQLAIKPVLERVLQRVHWDDGKPGRLLFAGGMLFVDPKINGGRLSFTSRSVPLMVVEERLNANESLDEVAADFGLIRS